MRIAAAYSDWKYYEVYADVPADTESLGYLFTVPGDCSVWVDDLKVEDMGEAPVKP